MNKSVVTIATAASIFLVSGIAQANVRSTSVKFAKLTSKSTYVKGSATKLATIKLSRYHTTYAYGKANSKGQFSLKLKHKLHANWKYRLTVIKKGYKTTTTYVKSAKIPASSSNNVKKILQVTPLQLMQIILPLINHHQVIIKSIVLQTAHLLYQAQPPLLVPLIPAVQHSQLPNQSTHLLTLILLQLVIPLKVKMNNLNIKLVS